MTTSSSRLLEPDAPAWTDFLAGVRHDYYHLPEYVSLCAREANGSAVAFLHESDKGAFLLPLIRRLIMPPDAGSPRESGYADALSPYGYPGPLIRTDADDQADGLLAEALAALTTELRAGGIVSCFVRLHPLMPLPTAPFATAGTLVQHGQTVSIDLTGSPEEMWRQTRHNHRRDINKAQRNGLTARIDDEWEHLDDFVELYNGTMTRLNASAGYFITTDYVQELRVVLGDALSLCIVELEGVIVSAGLFTEKHGIAQYHLSGTDAVHFAHRPLKTMLHFARAWAKERGNTVLHLGGGLGGQADQLFDFKAGFSDARHDFHTWRLVADESAYGALTASWEARSGEPAEPTDGFFPAYRKPLPQPS